MQTIASLSPEAAQVLMAFLREAHIACEARTISEESGLEATEILVADELFDQACEAADQWQEAMMAAAQERTQRRCPKCHSPDIERVEDIDYEKSLTRISAVFRCEACGYVIAT